MSLKIFQVDAFSRVPFRGNPAAVCILSEPRDEKWMRALAQEMNLSETAFLEPRKEGGFSLRWFTPLVEVNLCGHATLASAHILWEEKILKTKEAAQFHSRSGLLTAEKKGDWIELNFPATVPGDAQAPEELLKALGITPIYVGKTRFDYFLEVDSEDIVRSMKPDFDLLFKLPVRGVIVTSRSKSKEYDFISRFFAPGSGIAEDPVTGSAHCALAPYWASKLKKKEMVGYQASARGGVVRVRPEGDRVFMSGQSVTVFRGTLNDFDSRV